MFITGVPAQKDTTLTKIFVGGLPYHTTDKTLHEYFKVFGEIEEAVVITNRETGQSKGYGFVTMADKEAAESACKDPNPIIDGRKANVNLAYLGAKPRAIQAVIPHIMKPGATVSPVQYGYPQMMYPSTLMSTSSGLMAVSVPQSPVNQQYLDYSAIRQKQLDYLIAQQQQQQQQQQQYLNYSPAYISAAGQLGTTLDSCQPTTPTSPVRLVSPTFGYPMTQQLLTGTTATGQWSVGINQPQELSRECTDALAYLQQGIQKDSSDVQSCS